MSDEENNGAEAKGGDDEMIALLRQIRDLNAEMVAGQKYHQWLLLPIFALLAIMLILGLTDFL